MRLSGGAFYPRVLGLEKRTLQARVPLPVTLPPAVEYVAFDAPPTPNGLTQQVTQQSGAATVTLVRSGSDMAMPPVQVRVTTDPSSPYVGVNVGEVDQTVSFAQGQSHATLTVPI